MKTSVKKKQKHKKQQQKTLVIANLDAKSSVMDTLAQMQTIRDAQESGGVRVVALFNGYDHDPRELNDIPEVVAYAEKLVELGFISWLDVAPSLTGLPGVLGAYEIWVLSRGAFEVGKPLTPTEKEWEKFLRVLNTANARADEGFIITP